VDDSNTYSDNIYGSRFAAEHLPQHEMPEREMPPQVAARMIKDGQSYVHASISPVLTAL
jgi:glutamate decarboxylase